MYIAIANAIYSSLLQGARGGFPQACFGLDYNAITSDFTFTRNSFATRVNEFGLIETVTDLGSDLVQNGSFDELGSELVTNGDFENGSTDWAFIGTAEVSDGVGNFPDSTNSFLIQPNIIPLTVKTYKIQYEVVSTNGSNFRFAGGNSAFGSVDLDSATVGVKTVYLQSNGTAGSLQFNNNAFIGSIDNVSVKQVDPNDDWELGSDWVIQDNKLTYGGNTSVNYTRQLGVLTNNSVGKEYIINFEVLDSAFTIGFTSGSSFFDDENGNIIKSEFNVGVHTIKAFSINSLTDFRIYGYTDSGNGGSIDNVSVQEVLEDDVPRIDYTGSTFDVPVYGDELLTDGVISNFNGGIMTFTANGVNSVSDGTAITLRPRLLWSSLTVGKQYRIIGTPTVNSGSTNYSFYDGASYIKDNVATESFDITFTCGGSNVFFANDGSQTFDIDWDLSIKELTAYTTTDKGAFLLEPISTNLIDYSEDIEGSNWTTSGIATTTDVTTSPDGTQNADLIDSVSNGSCFISDSTLTFTIGNTYTFSVFAKKGNNDWIRTAHVSSATNASWFDLENGVVGTVNGVSGTIEDFGNGWYKCTNTFVATQATGGNQVFIGICDANGSTDAGASGQNDYVWGMQVEELSYATSYIPTSGTTVTRAQETCLDGVVSANSLEGVLYWEGSSYFDSTTIIAELSQGDITNRVSLFYQNGNDSRSSIRVNNVQNTLQGGGSLSSTKKLAIVWSNNIASFWVNGSQVDTDTYVGSIPEGVLTALNFAQVGGAAPFYGRTKDLRVYDKALTDDELINLTTI